MTQSEQEQHQLSYIHSFELTYNFLRVQYCLLFYLWKKKVHLCNEKQWNRRLKFNLRLVLFLRLKQNHKYDFKLLTNSKTLIFHIVATLAFQNDKLVIVNNISIFVLMQYSIFHHWKEISNTIV